MTGLLLHFRVLGLFVVDSMVTGPGSAIVYTHKPDVGYTRWECTLVDGTWRVK